MTGKTVTKDELKKELLETLDIIKGQIPEMVGAWTNATYEQKKQAIVELINDEIDIPFVPESLEAVGIGAAYDFIAKKIFPA